MWNRLVTEEVLKGWVKEDLSVDEIMKGISRLSDERCFTFENNKIRHPVDSRPFGSSMGVDPDLDIPEEFLHTQYELPEIGREFITWTTSHSFMHGWYNTFVRAKRLEDSTIDGKLRFQMTDKLIVYGFRQMRDWSYVDEDSNSE